MRVLGIEDKPFYEIGYESINTMRRIIPSVLQLARGYVDSLPDCLDGIIVTSDLQGREAKWSVASDPRLLGELLIDELELLAEVGEVPSLRRLGVILAGDFYSRFGLDRRGGTGDVRGIWRNFAKSCRWVVGVAGNHDIFSENPSLPEFENFIREEGINFLDGTSVELDGLKFAGISGIIGNPRKPFRWEKDKYIIELDNLLVKNPDVLILHDGPGNADKNIPGHADIAEVVEKQRCPLIVRGHKHWDVPLLEYPNCNQALNVDSRVVLLQC